MKRSSISYQYCDKGPDLSSAPVTPLAFNQTRPQVRTWISPAFRLDPEAEPDGVSLLVGALCRPVFHQIDDSSINNASHAHLTGIRLELEGPSSPQHRAECRTSCRSRSGCCRPSVNVDRGIWSSALRAWDDRRSVFNTAFPFGEFSHGFIYNKQVGRGGGAGTPSSVPPSSHLTLTHSHTGRGSEEFSCHPLNQAWPSTRCASLSHVTKSVFQNI